jgi:hypothetical protein
MDASPISLPKFDMMCSLVKDIPNKRLLYNVRSSVAAGVPDETLLY